MTRHPVGFVSGCVAVAKAKRRGHAWFLVPEASGMTTTRLSPGAHAAHALDVTFSPEMPSKPELLDLAQFN